MANYKTYCACIPLKRKVFIDSLEAILGDGSKENAVNAPRRKLKIQTLKNV